MTDKQLSRHFTRQRDMITGRQQDVLEANQISFPFSSTLPGSIRQAKDQDRFLCGRRCVL